MAINPMIFEPQPVDNYYDIKMLTSPLYEKLYFRDPDTLDPIDGTHIRLKLWYWTGNLSDPYVNITEPNLILFKDKLNISDEYIIFEISDYIKDQIEPEFIYSLFTESIISDSVIYFKYEYDIMTVPADPDDPTIINSTFSSNTMLGTLGWSWDYQYLNDGYSYFKGSFNEFSEPDRAFDPNIRNFETSYILGMTISNACIDYSDTPKDGYSVCAKEKFLIIYINKNGLFDYFTPTGKVVYSSKIEREKYNRTFSDPFSVSQGTTHMIKQYNLDVSESIIINTGIINQNQGQLVEEIIYSPKVYLVRIRPDATLSGGYYNSYQQLPVIVVDSDYERKTRLNNKGKISYNIKFDTTNNKIKNIR